DILNMYLHRHDFAIIQVSEKPFTGHILPKVNNPAPGDVVLLPFEGFVVIAFKTDNLGTWLIHCYVALHAASSLSLQIMKDSVRLLLFLWPPNNSPALTEQHRVCELAVMGL
ncbi:multicopper oxidase, partial [Calycina marina]